MQATRLYIHGFTTSDQSLAGPHAQGRIKGTSIDMSQATTAVYIKEQ